MKHIYNLLVLACCMLFMHTTMIHSITTQSLISFPQKAAEASLQCSDKAKIIAIETQVAQANEFFKQGDYAQAVEQYRVALSLQPDHVSAHYNVGLAYLALQDVHHAVSYLKRATDLDTNHFFAHYFLGYAYQLIRSFEKAVDAYNHCLSIDPSHFESHLNKGRALVNLGNLDAAITCYEQAISLRSLDTDANAELGYLYTKKGTLNQAVTRYKQAAEADPALDAYWQNQLNADTNFKIGICWHNAHTAHSVSVSLFNELATIPGISLYPLYTKYTHLPSNNSSFKDITALLVNTYSHMDHNTAIIKQMNLVITIDTDIAHIAGASDINTWLLSPYTAQQSTSPDVLKKHYPTITVYQQQDPLSWEPIINHLIQNVENLLFGNHTTPSANLIAEVSVGELVDKMSILEIKSERIQDPKKLQNILNEQQALKKVFETYISKEKRTKKLHKLMRKIKSVNEKLWNIEDDIRNKEAKKEFDTQFIQLARSVYFTNDERGEIKRKINNLIGSRLVEEKTYTRYQ